MLCLKHVKSAGKLAGVINTIPTHQHIACCAFDSGGTQRHRIEVVDQFSERIDEEDFNGCRAEEWLTIQGYTSIQLVTLLDLENKLAAASKNSPKLTATRTWIDSILSAFIENDSQRDNWPPAPFGFQETTTEAFAALTA
jgi:hypothetical protein